MIGYRLAARKRHDLVRDLLDAFLAQRFGGNMRRDREARRAPERMIVRQRLGVARQPVLSGIAVADAQISRGQVRMGRLRVSGLEHAAGAAKVAGLRC